MSNPVVRTRMHHFLENPDPFIQAFAGLPLYVITKDIFKLLMREDVSKSIQAMLQMGIARLPFPEMVVEMPTPVGSAFIRLETHNDTELGVIFGTIVTRDGQQTQTVTDRPIIATFLKENIHVKPDGFKLDAIESLCIAVSIGVALLMLNTRGIEKEMVVHEKLNRKRREQGRATVPSYSILRIGTVYDRSGVGHRVGRSGYHMPVHLRAGHVRMQFYGPNREKRKQIYIPPVLVNYHEGDPLPVPKPKILKV